MSVRDIFRRRRRRNERADVEPLTETDVQRLQRVQRSSTKTVRVLRRRGQ